MHWSEQSKIQKDLSTVFCNCKIPNGTNCMLNQTASWNIPEFTTRNTLYFSKEIFKKAMFFYKQGLSFKYFYNPIAMNATAPCLRRVLNIQMIKKVRRRFPMLATSLFERQRWASKRGIYLKARSNFNSSFSGLNYYSERLSTLSWLYSAFWCVWNFFSLENNEIVFDIRIGLFC